MFDELKELEKMIEELKADDTMLESLDQLNEFIKYAIENVDTVIAMNEKLVEIVKSQDERIHELEKNALGN